jgi:hypothetical protein
MPERAARRGKKGIHGGLVCDRAFLNAFALHSPIFAVRRQSHQINARVHAAQIRPTRKLVPQPDMLQVKLRVCAQIRLHQPFKAAALVTFGKGKAAVLVEYLLKGHGGRLQAG